MESNKKMNLKRVMHTSLMLKHHRAWEKYVHMEKANFIKNFQQHEPLEGAKKGGFY